MHDLTSQAHEAPPLYRPTERPASPAISQPASRWSQLRASLEQRLERHRPAAMAFALPASFVYDRTVALHRWYRTNIAASPGLHDARVRDVQAQVRRWVQSGSTRPMCTARAP